MMGTLVAKELSLRADFHLNVFDCWDSYSFPINKIYPREGEGRDRVKENLRNKS